MTEGLLALTLESAQAWALIIASMGSAIGSAVAAWNSSKAKQNAGEAKDAAHAIVDQAQTTDLKLAEIHEKANTAIQQNNQLVEQTDGHYTELVRLIAALVEAVTQKPAVVVASPEAERKVRKEDLERGKSGEGSGPPA